MKRMLPMVIVGIALLAYLCVHWVVWHSGESALSLLPFLAICIPPFGLILISHTLGKAGPFARIVAIIALAGCFLGYMIFEMQEMRVATLVSVLVSIPVVAWFAVRHPEELNKLKMFIWDTGPEQKRLDQKLKWLAEKRSCLRGHRETIRILTGADIASIDITFETGGNVRTQSPELITFLQKCLPGTMGRFSLPDAISKYGDRVQHLTVEIHSDKGTFSYPGIVHPKRPRDIVLVPPECRDYGGIILRGLKRWLDEDVLYNCS
ncbi:MAG: hypothetical protein ACYTEL_14740 [Planctomycetota bacterium]|jgi:anti-sigma regulatory factor (Ser/Thr protein kinase)